MGNEYLQGLAIHAPKRQWILLTYDSICVKSQGGSTRWRCAACRASELHSYDELGYNIYSVRTGYSHGSGTGMMRPSLCVDLKLLTFL